MFIVGALVVGPAVWFEFKIGPPWWVHVLLWVPYTLALTLLFLRLMKSWLVAIQYKHKAQEGQLDD